MTLYRVFCPTPAPLFPFSRVSEEGLLPRFDGGVVETRVKGRPDRRSFPYRFLLGTRSVCSLPESVSESEGTGDLRRNLSLAATRLCEGTYRAIETSSFRYRRNKVGTPVTASVSGVQNGLRGTVHIPSPTLDSVPVVPTYGPGVFSLHLPYTSSKLSWKGKKSNHLTPVLSHL